MPGDRRGGSARGRRGGRRGRRHRRRRRRRRRARRPSRPARRLARPDAARPRPEARAGAGGRWYRWRRSGRAPSRWRSRAPLRAGTQTRGWSQPGPRRPRRTSRHGPMSRRAPGVLRGARDASGGLGPGLLLPPRPPPPVTRGAITCAHAPPGARTTSALRTQRGRLGERAGPEGWGPGRQWLRRPHTPTSPRGAEGSGPDLCSLLVCGDSRTADSPFVEGDPGPATDVRVATPLRRGPRDFSPYPQAPLSPRPGPSPSRQGRLLAGAACRRKRAACSGKTSPTPTDGRSPLLPLKALVPAGEVGVALIPRPEAVESRPGTNDLRVGPQTPGPKRSTGSDWEIRGKGMHLVLTPPGRSNS